MTEEAKKPTPNKGKELSKCELCLTLCQCSDYLCVCVCVLPLFQELLQLADWLQNLGFFLSGESQLKIAVCRLLCMICNINWDTVILLNVNLVIQLMYHLNRRWTAVSEVVNCHFSYIVDFLLQ